jgi:hypothetical protein
MGILSFGWEKNILLDIFVLPLTNTGGYFIKIQEDTL